MFSSAPFATVAFAAIGGSLFFSTVVDSAVAAEQALARVSVQSQVVEQAQGADTILSIGSFANFVQEQSQGADAQTARASLRSQIFEQAQGFDSSGAAVRFAVSLQEFAQGADAEVVARAIFAVVLEEGGFAADSFLGRLLWETLDTAQAQNWKTITTVQLMLRVTVGGGFSSGAFSSGPFGGLGGTTRVADAPNTWQNLNSSQGTSWVLIKNA